MSKTREVNLFNISLKHRDQSDITDEQRKVLFNFGKEYYDEASMPGYRGYKYNGGYQDVARKMVDYFSLPQDAKILDVGCAKGFLLYDFHMINPGFQLYGVDISEYAIEHAMPEVRKNLICKSCTNLPYDNDMFDLVISTDTLHNLTEEQCRQAVREINRVGGKHSFIMVHSYRTEQEKENLIKWEATIRLVRSVDEWKQLYHEESYQGLYYWKIFI